MSANFPGSSRDTPAEKAADLCYCAYNIF
jgi:hypothetical protein